MTNKFNKPNPQSKRINSFLKNRPLINSIERININTSTETLNKMIINKIISYNGIGSNTFGLPGKGWDLLNQELETAINNGRLNYIPVSNETSTVYMAAYESEINKKIGISLCSSGPAVTMASTAIGNMYNETKSCVCFFGYSSNNFQHIDMAILKPITKAIIYIGPDTINPQQKIDDAFYIAKNGTSEFPGNGPVAVFIYDTLWDKPYKYTENNIPYIKTNNSNTQMLNSIFSNINSKSKIIIRVGERVSIDNIKILADLTNTYKNIYLHLTVLSKTYLNNIDNYTNVGVEGPMANNIINSNYSSVTTVIEIGSGIEYSLVNYEDIRQMMNINSRIFYIQDIYFQYPPFSSNIENTLITDVNKFVVDFVNLIPLRYPSVYINSMYYWSNTKKEQNDFFVNLLDSYLTQKNGSSFTTAAIIAQILKIIYQLQSQYNSDGNITKMIINDDKLYSTDVGLSSFIADSLIYHSNVNHILNFSQFAAIGCSVACVAGRLMNNEFNDAVVFLGDGGFLNVPGYIIDLTNVLNMFPLKRCLFILLNDMKYSAVTRSEELAFGGASTIISSTINIQSSVDMFSITTALMGNKFTQSLKITDSTGVNSLSNFVNNWYTKSNGYSSGGFYFIYYESINSMPIIIGNDY